MKIKEIEFLFKKGMISVEDDNLDYVMDALKDGGFMKKFMKRCKEV